MISWSTAHNINSKPLAASLIHIVKTIVSDEKGMKKRGRTHLYVTFRQNI